MDTQTKIPVVHIQGFFKSFKMEFVFEDFSTEECMNFVLMLENASFKGTTFEKKEPRADFDGKTGKVDSVEATKTKNGKDAFIAHILIDGLEGDDAKLSIMFFSKGAARKGDKVKIKKNDAGFPTFDILDEDGNVVPF
jgi:hypothetical protein